MKKIIMIGSLGVFLFHSADVFASNNLDMVHQVSPQKNNAESISPLKDITGWRYKSINGQIHKRLYNYSTQKWIGSWIPC